MSEIEVLRVEDGDMGTEFVVFDNEYNVGGFDVVYAPFVLAALLKDAGAGWLAVGKDEHGKLFVADSDCDMFHYLPKGACEYMKVVSAPAREEPLDLSNMGEVLRALANFPDPKETEE